MSGMSSDEEDFFDPFDLNDSPVEKKSYTKISTKICQGGQSTIFIAQDANQRKVAIKRFRLSSNSNGVNMFAMREISLMQEIQLHHHVNIVPIIDFYHVGCFIHVVYEYCETDLHNVIQSSSVELTHSNIKSIMKMILNGVSFLHEINVIHRDIKPENILIAGDGQLKICDFGVSRMYNPNDTCLSPSTGTTLYCPPEIFYGSRNYDTGVDIWGLGCVFAELYLRKRLFTGENCFAVLNSINSIMGTPTKENWPDVVDLPYYTENQDPIEPMDLNQLIPNASDDGIDLLKSMVMYDPKRRISAKEALNHEYFTNEPVFTPMFEVPILLSSPEMASPIGEFRTPVKDRTTPERTPSTKRKAIDRSFSASPSCQKKLKFL